MATITTEVEVDIEDFETYELVDELTSRMKGFSRKKITEKEIKSLKLDFDDLAKKLCYHSTLPVKTLDDKIKLEHLEKVWDKYPSWEIEKRLP